jgi:CSLREA domain-containing protein
MGTSSETMTLRELPAPCRSVFLALAAGLLVARAAAANTITVNSAANTTADDGFCTLREAIIAANTNTASGAMPGECAAGAAGTDTIVFAIPGAGVHTIQPAPALPMATEPVIINGYSQPGASVNTLAVGNNAVLLIEIDGINAGNISGGLLAIGGDSTVKGLVLNRAQGSGSYGLDVEGTGNTVTGNFIGIDPTGTIARGNGCQGLHLGGSNNTIGGLDPGDRNAIAATGGCGGNLSIGGSSNNQILNNYLGTNAAGTASLGGSGGVVLGTGSSGNTIGGTTAAARNVISGNTTGVNIFDSNTTGNIVEGNFIGTDASGTLAVPNHTGVQFGTTPANGNTIGGTAAGAGNVIAFNTGIGILMVGTPFGTGNAILGNSIFSNNGLGIDLGNDGVTVNDACDADTGPNNLQNFPVITSVTAGAGSTTVQGTLNSTASTGPYRIEIFASDACDPSGFGEGRTFLGSTTATTSGSCDGTFNVTLPVSVSPTARITATATDPNNNTSEFSACVAVETVFYTVSPCRVADTRDAPGPSGGPALAANTVRTFPVASLCQIPTSARAVAINLAVFQPSNDGDLRVYPAGGAAPLASAINFRTGIVRANNAVVPLGAGGQISVQCDMPSGSTNFFFDVYGYFQ